MSAGMANQQGVDVDYDSEQATVGHYRRCIEACVCPTCGAGPFKSMPGHASRVCGISREEMRRRAELPASASISSPELSRESAERAKISGSVAAMAGYVASIKGVSIQRELPEYSRRRISENVTAYNMSLSPTERSERARDLSRTQSAESRRKQSESLSAWHAAHPLSDEVRQARAAALNSPEARAKLKAVMQARRKPCGTVAAYKRGCRCEACKQAKRVSRG